MENEKELASRPHCEGAGENESENRAPEPAAAGMEGPGAGVGTDELPADLPAAFRELRREKQDLHEKLLRKQAELENFRKRMKRDKEDFLQHATADLVRALLPTLDGFERALKHRDENLPVEYHQGMELIYRELMEVLGRAGLTVLETLGKKFDPHLHQAVETIESNEHPDHEIIEELQRGYKLKQRLLRPAIVKVAVTPQKKATEVSRDESGASAKQE